MLVPDDYVSDEKSRNTDTTIIIWEFRTKIGRDKSFEDAYGSEGAWAQLFRRGEGYIGTQLFHAVDSTNHYLVIDRWNSEKEFEAFRAHWLEEYEALDQKCDALTEYEIFIGKLTRPT